MNCPVCDKVGLADYTVEHISCPQCNSDLKPILLLHQSNGAKPGKGKKYLVNGAFIIICIIAYLQFLDNLSKNRLINANVALTNQLQDSLRLFNVSKNKTGYFQNGNIAQMGEGEFNYCVKSGDNTIKIAILFFNDQRMYTKIAEDNKIKPPYDIKIGQILKIKQIKK